MLDKDPKLIGVIIGYAISAVAGALGGCGSVAAVSIIDRKTLHAANVIAYTFLGMVSGLLVFAFGDLLGITHDEIRDLARHSLLVGFLVPCILAGHNFGIRLMLKKFGWDVQVTIRRDEGKNRRKEDTREPGE